MGCMGHGIINSNLPMGTSNRGIPLGVRGGNYIMILYCKPGEALHHSDLQRELLFFLAKQCSVFNMVLLFSICWGSMAFRVRAPGKCGTWGQRTGV